MNIFDFEDDKLGSSILLLAAITIVASIVLVGFNL